jgi:hypothetical protein
MLGLSYADQFNLSYAHYESCSKEWGDWCNDVSIFYAYNIALFNRAVPVIIFDDEELKRMHKYRK